MYIYYCYECTDGKFVSEGIPFILFAQPIQQYRSYLRGTGITNNTVKERQRV